jgi:glycosyltransferase involved in cell wall biosynthesis
MSAIARPAPSREAALHHTGAFAGRTMVIAGAGKPDDVELRRRIAADEMPDVVSAEDALGPTIVDDRYFAALPGLRGALLRRLPLLAAQALEVLWRGGSHDAVLTWGDRPAIVVGALLRLRRRRPAHVAILMWPSKPKKAALLRHALPGIDRLIVWPPLQRQFVERRLRVPRARFVDARAPVDVAFWRPQDGARDMICSVGQEMRDYGTLVEALRSLDVPCHIAAGSGLLDTRFLEREWRSNVGARELPPNVTVGRRSHAELRQLYARSRFVVVPLLPSDMDNGITVILEAFAAGRAVICTETAGQTGVLEHGVNCLRVPPRDPLALWNDPEECGRLGAAGRELICSGHGQDHWRATLVQAVTEAVAAHAAG